MGQYNTRETIRAVSYTHLDASGRKDRPDTETHRRKSAMAGIATAIKQRDPAIAETEQRISELEQQLEKGRLIVERIKKLKERRSDVYKRQNWNSVKGKYVLLDFWASWNKESIATQDSLVPVQKALKKNNFVIILSLIHIYGI